jgi:Rgg/GadR/MutR family transcriptional activator
MINYGQTLRNIRESKGMSLKEASDGIMSSAFLSKIERDISIPNLDLLLQLLDRLRTTYAEFSYLLTREVETPQFQFELEFSKATVNDDTYKLDQLAEKESSLYQKTNDIRHRFNAITAIIMKNEIDHVPQSEALKTELKTFLLNVEDWGIYELALYGNTMPAFNGEELVLLTKTAIRKANEFWNFANMKELLISIIYNTMFSALENNYDIKLTSLINSATSLSREYPLSFASIGFNALKSIVEYRGGKVSAKEDMKQTLQIFRYFNQNKRAQDMSALWEKYTGDKL